MYSDLNSDNLKSKPKNFFLKNWNFLFIAKSGIAWTCIIATNKSFAVQVCLLLMLNLTYFGVMVKAQFASEEGGLFSGNQILFFEIVHEVLSTV